MLPSLSTAQVSAANEVISVSPISSAASVIPTRLYPNRATISVRNKDHRGNDLPVSTDNVLTYEFSSMPEYIQFMFNASTSVESHSTDWYELIKFFIAPNWEWTLSENGTPYTTQKASLECKTPYFSRTVTLIREVA